MGIYSYNNEGRSSFCLFVFHLFFPDNIFHIVLVSAVFIDARDGSFSFPRAVLGLVSGSIFVANLLGFFFAIHGFFAHRNGRFFSSDLFGQRRE